MAMNFTCSICNNEHTCKTKMIKDLEICHDCWYGKLTERERTEIVNYYFCEQ